MRYFLTAAVAAAALACAPGAHAEDSSAGDLNGVWFAGGSVDDSQAAYAGAVVALPGARLGKGLAIRGTANAGSYDYESGGQTINGDYVGGEIALVYQTSGPWGWANFSLGPRLTDTRLKPDDPGNKRRGTRLDAGMQADGAFDGARWRLSWLGSYAPVDEVFETHVQLGRKLAGGKYRIGIEGGVLGDPSFTKGSAGAFVALPFAGKAELQLASGLSFQQGRSARAYGAIGLSSVF